MKHFYSDGYLNEVIERHPFGWEQDCTVLRYLDVSKPLEAGMDAGNMLSMVFWAEERAYHARDERTVHASTEQCACVGG